MTEGVHYLLFPAKHKQHDLILRLIYSCFYIFMAEAQFSNLPARNPGLEHSISDVVIAAALYDGPEPLTHINLSEQIGNISDPTVVSGVREMIELEMLDDGPEVASYNCR